MKKKKGAGSELAEKGVSPEGNEAGRTMRQSSSQLQSENGKEQETIRLWVERAVRARSNAFARHKVGWFATISTTLPTND